MQPSRSPLSTWKMGPGGEGFHVGFWDTVFINPMINGLIVLEQLFGNFGIAIIVFTILVRLATLPLTLRQLHAGRKMQAITPQSQELQKKYKDPKRRQEETM